MKKSQIKQRNKCFFLIKCLLIFVCSINRSNLLLQAQIKEVVPISIGENIPDQIWDMPINVMNNPDGKNIITLSEYKGKLILLDFWGTYCSSCIGGFPHLIDIQEKNKGKIEILAVSNEGREKLDKFFSSGAGKDRKIHTTVEERTLAKYFPHLGVPHTIWISPDGKYLNPTNNYEVTQENIDALLRNEKSSIRIKFEVDRKKPLLISDNFDVNDNLHLGFYSLFFTGYCPSYPSGSNFKRDEFGKVYGRQFTNKKLTSIIKEIGMQIFNENNEYFTDRRVIFKTKNPLLYDLKDSFAEELPNDQYFSYELIVPKHYSDSLYSYMYSDLNKYLNVKLNLQKVKTKCLVLIRTSKKDKIKSNGNVLGSTLLEDNNRVKIYNEPLESLISILNVILDTKLPIIDETGYKEKVEIDLQGINNLSELKRSLKIYDLNIIQQERELLMYIIEDK